MTALFRVAFMSFHLVVIAIAAQVVTGSGFPNIPSNVILPLVTCVRSDSNVQGALTLPTNPNPQQLLTFAQQFCFAKNTINAAIIGCGVQAQSPIAYAVAQALSGYVSNFCTNAVNPVCGLNLVSTTPYLQPVLNAFQSVDAARFTEVLTAGTCAQDAKAKLIQALTTCVDPSLDFSGLCPPDLIPTSIENLSTTASLPPPFLLNRPSEFHQIWYMHKTSQLDWQILGKRHVPEAELSQNPSIPTFNDT
ncbi:hypothetical protein BCR33DRAFT_738291 [Rhizoclosmatium globosum]|uniref:Secreted protein n=1 Tax=Rhizoclosmatium globosum TaxID=329046 RepID=A0A1Y2CAS1_9FUNG|nr:hypothetical protein BCR33DRAFT_738291 [Rhizoclosmatium globosum]|eukprot:ORY44130.1 hypothetical protein BCR33DRAFT_738291 [Rhizoclosmatium globosum]